MTTRSVQGRRWPIVLIIFEENLIFDFSLCVWSGVMPSTFIESWLNHPEYGVWLQKAKEPTKARCRACEKTFDIASMGHQAVKSHSKGAHHIAHVAKLEKSVKNSSLLTDFMPMKPSTSYTTCGDGDVLAKLPEPTPTPSTFRLKEDTLDAE